MFFFFKQKTAYGVRISYWSSYVYSSDLPFETSDAVAIGFKEPAQGIAHGFVIVDNKNGAGCLGCGHTCNSWGISALSGACDAAQGSVKRKMVPPSGFALAHKRP